MRWIDPTKGKLDYLLGFVPFASLLFVVVAYFYTVHPHFMQVDELQRSRERVSELESALAREVANGILLTEKMALAEERLSSAQQQAQYLVHRLHDASPNASMDEIKRDVMLRHVSVESASEVYSAFITDGSFPVIASEVRAEFIRPTDSSQRYLFLTHDGYCGSGGCTGALFIEEFGTYCFSMWSHSRTLQRLTQNVSLTCNDIMAPDAPSLEDIVGFPTP